MELISKDSIFEFNPDTLRYLRERYDLDKPRRIEEAINQLDDWIQKQTHLMKKDFARDYLEKTIIISQGSVERAKRKLDNICTFRTIYPELFARHDIKNFHTLNNIHCTFLPKMTEDNSRVYILNNKAKTFDKGFVEFYKYFPMQCEYIQAHGYCDGIVFFLDCRETSVMENLAMLNKNDMKKCITIMEEGYGMRVKGFHFITTSKAIDSVIILFKRYFNSIVGEHIVGHRTLDTLYNYIPKDYFPEDYGGEEKPLAELHKKFQDVLRSKEFTDYFTEMNKACTYEDLRQGRRAV